MYKQKYLNSHTYSLFYQSDGMVGTHVELVVALELQDIQ